MSTLTLALDWGDWQTVAWGGLFVLLIIGTEIADAIKGRGKR